MSIGLIVPLIMALMMFDNLDDREFSGSLGRLCLSSFAVRWRWSLSV